MKIIRSNRIDYASMIMMVAMAYATLVAPNGSSPSCNEMWCILLWKTIFAFMAYVFFEGTFFHGAPFQRLFCRALFGKKFYEGYAEEIRKIGDGQDVALASGK
jgi:hypothetical protein